MRGHRTVTFNSSSRPTIVNVRSISPVFVLEMELPVYGICRTRREYNCRPKTLMRKATLCRSTVQIACWWMATTASPASKRRDPLRCADKSDGVARVIDHRYLNALQLSTKGHLCLRSQELQGK